MMHDGRGTDVNCLRRVLDTLIISLTSMLSFTFPLAAAHRLTWEIGRSSHITHWIPVRSASIHYSLLWSLKTLKLLKVLWPLIDHFLSIKSTVISTHCTHFTIILNPYMWYFIVASLRHTCAIIMLSNQHLDMPHLWGGWIISFTNTDLDRFVNNIWEK